MEQGSEGGSEGGATDGRDDPITHVIGATSELGFLFDGDGTCIACNEAARAHLGYAAGQLCGTSAAVLFDAEGNGPTGGSVPFDIEGNPHQETGPRTERYVTLQRQDGSLFITDCTAIPLDGGYCVLAARPSEQESNGSNKAAAQMIRAMDDPVFMLNGQYRIVRTNAALLNQTGYEREEVLGRDIRELVPATEFTPITRRLNSITTEDEPSAETFELPLLTSDGTHVLTEASVSVISGQDGNGDALVGVLRDIQERKQRERDLELLKQVLVRVVRHNVRNELMIVQGHAEIIDEEASDDLEEHTGVILDTSQRLLDHSRKARLIEQVIETDELYEISLVEQIEDIVAEIRASTPDATVEVDLPESVTVQAHPKLPYAIEELIRNAIDHADDDPWVRVWLDDTAQYRTVFVEDRSGGLAEHEINVLREGAENRLEHGSGVGLWLVRWLAEYSQAELLVHRTVDGSLMGLRFSHPDTDADLQPIDSGSDSPIARALPPVTESATSTDDSEEVVIGRVEERHALEEAYEALERAGGQAAIVTGEAGVGKTTVITQFCRRLEAEAVPSPVIATASCEAGLSNPYAVFRDLLDDLPTTFEFETILGELAENTRSDPELISKRKESLYTQIAEEIRGLAIDQPVVLVLEDLHLAAQGSLELFEHLIDDVARWGPPVLFVGTYRSDASGRNPLSFIEDTIEPGRYTVLELEPFDAAEIEQYLATILDISSLPESFVTAVRDHTGGEPLFVAEIGHQLVTELGANPEPTELPTTLDTIAIPSSIESIVNDRLATLPGPVQSTIELGAVIGETFEFDVLRAASQLSETALVSAVEYLVTHDIWERVDERITFVHGVVQQQTLSTLSTDRYQNLHERVAAAFESVYGDEIDRHAGRLARHYEETGEFDAAVRCHRQAGAYLSDAYAHRDALEHYDQAYELGHEHDVVTGRARARLCCEYARIARIVGEVDTAKDIVTAGLDAAPAESVEACRLQGILAASQITQGEFDTARETTKTQIELATRLGDTRLEASGVRRCGEIARRQGAYEEAREDLEQSLELFEELEDVTQIARTLDSLGTVATELGEYETAREYHEQSLANFREQGDRIGEAMSLGNLGDTYRERGEFDTARDHYEDSLAIAEDVADRTCAAEALNNLGIVAWRQGNHEDAEAYYAESLELRREIGDRQGEARSLNNFGILAFRSGEYDEATDYWERSLERFEELGDRQGMTQSLNNLGVTALLQSEYERAREFYEQSLEIRREIGDTNGEAGSLNNLGALAARQGEFSRARSLQEESLERYREVGDRNGVANCLLDLGDIARLERDYEQAETHYEEALSIATEIGGHLEAATAHHRLGILATQMGNLEQATSAFDAAQDGFEAINYDDQVAKVNRSRGKLRLKQGALDDANALVETARAAFTETGSTHWVGRSEKQLGDIAATNGASESAQEHWTTALDHFETVNAPHDALATLEAIVRHWLKQGEPANAQDWHDRATALLEEAPAEVAQLNEAWIEETATDLES